jgi:lysophospholipase L1-like esterase
MDNIATFESPTAKSYINADEAAIKPPPHQERFLELHHSYLARTKEGPVGLLFLGDSIIYQWIRHPEIWEPHYAQYNPANFGIAGDTTQQVLWRIENGTLDHIQPQVVVLLIGTNNSGSHTADEIIAANTRIVRQIHERIPDTKVLLLGIFPQNSRDLDDNGIPRDDGVTRMAIIENVNQALAKLDNGKNVRFLDIGSIFLNEGKTIPEALMYDQLHLTKSGYQLWAEAMQPLLSEMMGSD